MKVQLLAQLVSERISELAPDKTRTTSLLAMSLLLTACGSSGGDSSNGASATTQPSDNESITIGIPIENDTTPSTPPSSSDDDSVTTPPAEPVTPVDPPAEPVTPVDPPAEPVTPVDPPAEPVTPVDPPAEPVTPVDPPAEPVTPADPPAEPVTPADPPAQPVAPVEPPAPVITSTLVTFDITVPVHVSDELQLDVFSGDNELQAAWVVDETWTVTDTLPANSVSELRVVFYDHFGSTTLATYDSTVETAEREAQDFTVNADEFDSTIWDNDGDEISNLDELIAGTDPDFAELVGAPNEPPGLTSVQYSGFDLELFWSRGTDDDGVVIGYDIFRDDEQITDRLDALSFYDGSVQPETDYTYDIYSVDNDGLRSRAATLLITTPEDTPVNGPANAASLTGGGSASWFISDGLTTSSGTGPSGSCSYSGGAGSGVGISDSRLPNNGDAFDLGSLMWVNGVQVGGFLRSATASTSNFASVPIANLQVHTEFHAISSLPVLRNLTSFTNDTSEDIFVVINWASNFGADSGNRIITTSSGDNMFAANDRWAITDDASDGGRDPANTTVFYGPDSPVSMSVFTNTSVFNCYGSEGLTARIDVTIPAGETRALMLFHGMSVTQDNARSLASMFDDTPTLASPLTEGLTEAQLLNVINWSY